MRQMFSFNSDIQQDSSAVMRANYLFLTSGEENVSSEKDAKSLRNSVCLFCVGLIYLGYCELIRLFHYDFHKKS